MSHMGARGELRKYATAVRLQINATKIYRANFMASIINIPVSVAIAVIIWTIAYAKVDSIGSYNYQEMLTYYIFIILLGVFFRNASGVHRTIFTHINNGTIAVYLVRPMNYVHYLYSIHFGLAFSYYTLAMVVVAIYTALVSQFNLSITRLLLFMVSSLFAYNILFLIQVSIGMMTFYIGKVNGINDIVSVIRRIMEGSLIPISLLPFYVVKIALYMPFQHIYYSPITIIQGNNTQSVTMILAVQVLWMFGLYTLQAVLWRNGRRRQESYGG